MKIKNLDHTDTMFADDCKNVKCNTFNVPQTEKAKNKIKRYDERDIPFQETLKYIIS